MPHPAADVDLARLEVEVPTTAVRSRRGAPILAVGPGKRSPDVRLVRRFVLGEPNVAIDPERRSGRVRTQWDTPRPEPLVDGHAELLERPLEQALVFALARLEPGPVVVDGEVREELDGFGTE